MKMAKQIVPITTVRHSSVKATRAPRRAILPRLLRRIAQDAVLILLWATLPAAAMYSIGRQETITTSITAPAGEDVFWIDARSDEDFAKGHVSGALSLNEKNWEHALPRLFETWQPPQPIFVYCSAGCPASTKIAAKLTELGIEQVRVLEGGFEEWKQSGR